MLYYIFRAKFNTVLLIFLLFLYENYKKTLKITPNKTLIIIKYLSFDNKTL